MHFVNQVGSQQDNNEKINPIIEEIKESLWQALKVGARCEEVAKTNYRS